MAKPTALDSPLDPRIHTDFSYLKSLQRKARQLSFLPRQRSKSLLAGRHGSRMRGRGLNFEELRDYRVGDDIRAIDWRVTARMGRPHVRVYAEEKDRSALLIVDQRMSMFFGSRRNMKSVTASEAAALCAYGIFARGDRVGAVVFNDTEVKAFRPSKRPQLLEQVVRCISQYNLALHCDLESPATSMHLNRPLKAATEQVGHDHLVVVISDFDAVDDATEQHLGQLCAHNDVILVAVQDPLAQTLPKDLQMVVSDGQSQMTIDTRSDKTHARLQQAFSQRLATLDEWQQRLPLTVMRLTTERDTFDQIAEALAVRRR
ncbi:DUF58 domain-containing protein [Gilvimarinus algae]|uniref:DUF58 domain-containing protein n=1 Tax=Gilvimarinus algae TaxID=3058037 RepID=A0ABT8TAY1_9GAMM|nr:DUF58 domain-containing protein [Gilvimarinus sp. SDUM040014]MDO3381271.1 DUF58 domain-containing protein [Gilvimarinus sp. SDUM040014]